MIYSRLNQQHSAKGVQKMSQTLLLVTFVSAAFAHDAPPHRHAACAQVEVRRRTLTHTRRLYLHTWWLYLRRTRRCPVRVADECQVLHLVGRAWPVGAHRLWIYGNGRAEEYYFRSMTVRGGEVSRW
ncbi:hypothetical protein JB92DRAFT_2990160 [Gautieria morchelliformis]|nr:hypothetical protein JB92DRAFT_2990160 [Gautieria morchelliformis]